MADPTWLPGVLRAEGLEVRIHQPHGKCGGAFQHGNGDFGDIWGVMAHHTGSFGETEMGIAHHPSLDLCSQLLLDQHGVYTVCGVGIAWHAGDGSYPGVRDGNAQLIGIEAANDGGGSPGKPHRASWSDAQYDAYVRGVAAILRHLGHDSSRVIGHKEWAGAAQGKWDPGAIDMTIFRRDVQAAINNSAGGADVALEETFKNYRGEQVTLGTAVHFMDKHINEIREQLGGPVPFKGWKQLGDKTVVDSLADAHRKIDHLINAVEALTKSKAA